MLAAAVPGVKLLTFSTPNTETLISQKIPEPCA